MAPPIKIVAAALLVLLMVPSIVAAETSAAWDLAQQNAETHRFSTLFTARQVSEDLADEESIRQAIAWCQSMGITKVYLETFRSRHLVDADTIAQARDRFRDSGFLVSGCVTTTQIGKISTGWNLISCYTSPETQKQVREIFEFTAKLFDEIMIDDFWFTDCECKQCVGGRESGRAVVDGKSFPMAGDSWSDYRRELMLQVSNALVLQPARRVNSDVRLIIKYPQWYDQFQERGYDVVRQTKAFDLTWVGTEIRDEEDERWGGRGRTTAYFLQSWVQGLDPTKCGGGWYDTLGTTPATYLVQARQTILGGARESMLFNAGNLRFKEPGISDAAALQEALPELFELAAQVRDRSAVGVAMYKPPHSDGGSERKVFEHVGMMGIPFAPVSTFPAQSPAAFFSLHALKDSDFVSQLRQYLNKRRPTMITDGLAEALAGRVNLDRDHVHVIQLNQDPTQAWKLPNEQLRKLRSEMARPFDISYEGPARTAMYAFDDGSWVLESFRDTPIDVSVNGKQRRVDANGWTSHFKTD